MLNTTTNTTDTLNVNKILPLPPDAYTTILSNTIHDGINNNDNLKSTSSKGNNNDDSNSNINIELGSVDDNKVNNHPDYNIRKRTSLININKDIYYNDNNKKNKNLTLNNQKLRKVFIQSI